MICRTPLCSSTDPSVELLQIHYKHVARDSLVSFKFLLLGESGVGKSSLILRFTGEGLKTHNVPTVGLDNKVKMMDLLGFSLKLCVSGTLQGKRSSPT